MTLETALIYICVILAILTVVFAILFFSALLEIKKSAETRVPRKRVSDKYMQIRVSEYERKHVERLASAEGLRLAEYARSTLLNDQYGILPGAGVRAKGDYRDERIAFWIDDRSYSRLEDRASENSLPVATWARRKLLSRKL